MSALPTDSAARKRIPLASGVLDYFPLALIAVAELSMAGNDQHNKGQPLHWAREKSNDHDDCLMRHFLERGTIDTDGIAHRAKVAWRALAALQLECERNQPTGCNAPIQPARQTAKQAYDAQTARDVAWSAKRGDYTLPEWRPAWLKPKQDDLPPNLAAAVSAPNCDGYAYLPDIGIGDVEPRHPMQAEVLRDEFERGDGETGV